MTKLNHPVKDFAKGIGEGTKEFFEGSDLRNPEKFKQYQGQRLKDTLIMGVVALGGILLYTWIARGW